MAIAVQLAAAFLVDGTTYAANLTIPASGPTADTPVTFSITSTPSGQGATATSLVTVAVGATNQVYVAVAPPIGLINTAAGSNVVENLNVIVSDGTYSGGKFTA